MANEVMISANLAYSDASGVKDELGVASFLADVTTKQTRRSQQSIATTETTLNLGGLAAVGWAVLVNLDATNYVELKTGASGTIFAKIPPGGVCLLCLGSGVTAPVAVANTAACLLDILLVSQ